MNRKLSKVERLVLESTVDLLSSESAEIFRKQISEVNLIQRYAGGKAVNFYRVRWRCFKRDFSIYFPYQLKTARLARIVLETSDDSPRSIIATVWLVEGRVFSIDFMSPPPKDQRAILKHATLLCDPSDPAEVKRIAANPVPIRNLLAELGMSSNTLTLAPPLRSDQRTELINQLPARLPEDWIDIAACCDGFNTDLLKVHGLTGLPSAHFREYTLLVLAEAYGLDCCLCARYGDQTGNMYLVNYEGIILRSIGTAFKTALREYLTFANKGK